MQLNMASDIEKNPALAFIERINFVYIIVIKYIYSSE